MECMVLLCLTATTLYGMYGTHVCNFYLGSLGGEPKGMNGMYGTTMFNRNYFVWFGLEENIMMME